MAITATAAFTVMGATGSLQRLVLERSDSWLDVLAAVATMVAAIGTVAAVVVALYLNLWRESRRRPELELSIDEESAAISIWALSWEESEFDPGYPPGQPEVLYLRVSNQSGRTTAQDVEVLLTERIVSDKPGGFTGISFENRSLAWGYLTTEDGRPVTSVSIPAGVMRKVEVARFGPSTWLDAFVSAHSVRAGGPAEDPMEPIGSNALYAIPPYTYEDFQDLSEWLERYVTLTISARDVDAVVYEAKLEMHVDKSGSGKDGSIEIWFDWVDFRQKKR
jgi:hypothetical protein